MLDLEGFGEEVVLALSAISLIFLALSIHLLRGAYMENVDRVHPEEQDNVDSVRQTISGTGVDGQVAPRRFNSDNNMCPVCLNDAHFAVETNCGHIFCGRCMIAYRNHGNWTGAVRCPVCRQQVTILFQLFTDDEVNTADPDEAVQRNRLQGEIGAYNRRFSGQPRPLMDYVRELPTLLRHLWNEFFSVGGLVYMFRLRIVLCLLAALTYLVSPLDILPEAAFGILGLMDDVFVLVLIAIYLSMIYRGYIANRNYFTGNLHLD